MALYEVWSSEFSVTVAYVLNHLLCGLLLLDEHLGGGGQQMELHQRRLVVERIQERKHLIQQLVGVIDARR